MDMGICVVPALLLALISDLFVHFLADRESSRTILGI